MCIDTLSGTEHVTFDHRCTGCSSAESYSHRRTPFHAAYLTATKHVAFDGAIANADIRSLAVRIGDTFAFFILAHHGFFAFERVIVTLTATIDTAADGDRFVVVYGR